MGARTHLPGAVGEPALCAEPPTLRFVPSVHCVEILEEPGKFSCCQTGSRCGLVEEVLDEGDADQVADGVVAVVEGGFQFGQQGCGPACVGVFAEAAGDAAHQDVGQHLPMVFDVSGEVFAQVGDAQGKATEECGGVALHRR